MGTHGFAGPIRCTAATADLLAVMLPDSARLQQENADYVNRKGYSRHQPAVPLYTEADAMAALGLMEPVAYHEWLEVPCGRARFSFAGHILGSAHIAIEHDGRRVVFSGDVGRWDVPVLKDPQPPASAGLLVFESTYGGRFHAPGTDPDAMIEEVIGLAVGGDGILVIPAFSIGRTQEVLYRIRSLEDAGRIPRIPVIVDSPMAISATELYRTHHEEHDLEMQAIEARGGGPLEPSDLRFSHTVEDSKRLNGLDGPAIIISASGMATGGRVPHHLKRRLAHPENVVAFVGYQAEGTLGRKLVDGADEVRIFGTDVTVRAEVRRLDAFSAHADETELLRWVDHAVPERIALVHGEDGPRRELAERLRAVFGVEVLMPERGDVIEV